MRSLQRPIDRMVRDRHVLLSFVKSDKVDDLISDAVKYGYPPHNYPSLKRYIKSIVVGRSNSPYKSYAGYPTWAAGVHALGGYLPNLATGNSSLGNLFTDTIVPPVQYFADFCTSTFTSSSNCTSKSSSTSCSNGGASLPNYSAFSSLSSYSYTNGTSIAYLFLYSSSTPWSPGQTVVEVSPSGFFAGSGGCFSSATNASIKYAYAPYVSSNSNNQLNIVAPTEFELSTSIGSLSYVYFGLIGTNSASCGNSGGGATVFSPTFYSTGSFSFSANTVYLAEWEWTYT